MGRRRCRRPTEVGRENILPYPYPYLYLIAIVVVVAQCYYDYGEDGEGLGSLDQDKIHQEKDKKTLYL